MREYHQKSGLVAIGLAGPGTLAHMKLFTEITADTVKSSEVSGSAVTGPAGDSKTATADVGATAASGTR